MYFKYECLLIINKTENTALYNLCNTKERFLELLKKDKNISINKESNIIFHKNSYPYELLTNEIENKEQRYFHFKISFNKKEENIEEYQEFLKLFRTIMIENKLEIEILRDDFPLHYSEEAYSLINKTENHMRKFIKYFLITKVGINWIDESPTDIKKVISDNKNRDNNDKLKRLDFIHLGNFLFDKYSKKNLGDLQKLINTKDIKSIDKEILKDYIAESNWDKYFSKHIKCENEFLQTRWEKLYEFRNDIAHNKDFTASNLERVKTLFHEINKELKKAFKEIDEIKIVDTDKNEINNIYKSIISENQISNNGLLSLPTQSLAAIVASANTQNLTSVGGLAAILASFNTQNLASIEQCRIKNELNNSILNGFSLNKKIEK